MNASVDAFVENEKVWREEFRELRRIVSSCPLTEELKWGKPCYSHEGKNVVLIHGFKEYCALLFMKGALLKDAKGILIQQTENVQAARQLRFTGAAQIAKLEKTVKAYLMEAIEIEKAGLKVELKQTRDYPVPQEFQARLDGDRALRDAFEALTPGRQRGYLFYFSQAKQAKTREDRVEKCLPKIMDGLGLDDSP
jgi:uncharacterized protein YdeI (YjbR/CyaY-like superfamily)